MIANVVIGSVIFGYAGWTIFRFIQKVNEAHALPAQSRVHAAQVVMKKLTSVSFFNI